MCDKIDVLEPYSWLVNRFSHLVRPIFGIPDCQHTQHWHRSQPQSLENHDFVDGSSDGEMVLGEGGCDGTASVSISPPPSPAVTALIELRRITVH